MARINLLPWREELRREKQRQFGVVAAGSAVLMGVIVFYVHMHFQGLIDYQERRNGYLKREIQAVEAQIREIKELEKQKDQLLARMRVIEQLQGNRPEVVHLFEELVKSTPEGLHLTTLRQSGRNLQIEGIAQSNARVSSFMRSLDASPWFNSPKLEYIQVDSKGGSRSDSERSRQFRLTVNQTSPQDQAGEGGKTKG